MRQARVNRSGFTYLEVLLALAIFVIASAGVLGSFLAMHQVSENAASALAATNHLGDMLEEINATEFSDLQTAFPPGVADGPVTNPYAPIVGGYTLDDEQIIVTYPDQDDDRVEMVVTVNWTYRSRARTAQFSTVRTRG